MKQANSAAAALRHPWVELAARYRTVAAAAWAMRHELAGPRRLADEAAFLPAALSLQETPVHPAPRRAMAVIIVLFLAALVWTTVGQVDIVAVAAGRIVVSERSKLIQPLDAAVVRVIHVRDGDKVRAGQLLVELDPTGATADKANLAEQLRTMQAEAERSQALVRAVTQGAAPRLQRVDADQQALLAAEWQDFNSKRDRLRTELMRRRAERDTAQEQIVKLQSTLPLARRRETDTVDLASDGFAPRHAGEDRARERLEIERDLATLLARGRESEAAIQEAQDASRAQQSEAVRVWSDRGSQARSKVAQLLQESSKSEQRERLTRLCAPAAGTVQQLAVHTAGGVVTPAQALMVIVPDGAEVTAEVMLENKDIGFVHPGQAVAVKLETFSFTRYGTVPATVLRVSADAVVDEKRGAIFPATLRLLAEDIAVDDRRVALTPGLSLTAEIQTGRRRVIEYLLSPLQQRLGESFRER